MKNKNILLLRALLRSTSQRNIIRYTTDKKKRKKLIGNIIGKVVLYILLVGFTVFTCIGYGAFGIIDAAPEMCALVISVLSLVFTFFKSNGYLFNFKEYDMLMSLPFEARSVAGCKFLYMYVNTLPWYLSVSGGTMVVYGIYAHPPVLSYIVWAVMTFFLPIIPMLIASFFGFLITKISAGFKKLHIIQTILTFAFVLFIFSLRFIMEDLFKNDQIGSALEMTSQLTGNVSGVYLPAGWFSNGVKDLHVSDILLLIGVSVVLFAIVFAIVGSSYRNINSSLKSHAAARNFRMKAQKKRSVVWSIAYKEFKRLTASTSYMVNGALGEILAILISVVIFFIGFDRVIAMVMKGSPVTATMLQPAIPLIVYFFVGMVATTTASPSLEGKNYWIIQSLPIEMKTVYQGKMLFNMCLSVPFTLVSTLVLCVSARTPVLETLLYLILGVVLCAFSTAWGCVCGVKHIKLDWENEIEVIKQNSAVAIYLLPNMFAVMGLTVGAIFLGMHMNHLLIALILIAVAGLLAFLSYRRVLSLAKKG